LSDAVKFSSVFLSFLHIKSDFKNSSGVLSEFEVHLWVNLQLTGEIRSSFT